MAIFKQLVLNVNMCYSAQDSELGAEWGRQDMQKELEQMS